MSLPADPIVIDGHILVVADCLNVSFQRYQEDMLRGAAEVPRSHGALPIELRSPRHGYLPVRPGEGIWLGLSPHECRGCCVQVGWLGASGGDDVPQRWCATLSDLQRLHGLYKSDGTFCPFIRDPRSAHLIPCAGIVITVENSEAVELRFVSVPEFESRTGGSAPGPISPDDAYGGWRLP